MSQWRGPETPFSVLFDDQDGRGVPLPRAAAAHYAPWPIPPVVERPWVYVNFVASLDGRVSFNLPGVVGGGPVSDFNANDKWLMGLLRARADAVMVGDNTLRAEPEHLWTPEYICPGEPGFADLRRAEGRRETPLQVIVTLSGKVPAEAQIFEDSAQRVLVAGTESGVGAAQALLAGCGHVEYLALGRDSVDLDLLLARLTARHAVHTLLCEGGPTLHGSLLGAGLVDEEFITLSPLMIGNPADGPARPGLLEGIGFAPASAPRLHLAGLLRSGEHLFLRSRYRGAARVG
ncbi:MAG TPA: dihydrofolate reductase family protein [Chloroflexota bacterium]|nr:dihydrofolate reductase family protein [Chloroflexota bacterium]